MSRMLLIILFCLTLISAQLTLAEPTQADIDLTALDWTEASDAIISMMETPTEFRGRTARIQGYISYIEGMPGEEETEFYLMVGDISTCCNAQIQFLPTSEPEELDPLMFQDTPFIVEGVLDIFDNEGYEEIRLIDATVEWPKAEFGDI